MNFAAAQSRPSTPAARAFALAALVSVVLLAGCRDRSAATRSPAPAPVVVGQVERKAVPIMLDAIGTVEPSRTASVRSQVTGTLLKIDFREGQEVKEGDLLFEIDPRPFQNALSSAQADLARYQVQLETARAQAARYRTLNASAAISQDQFQSVADAERAAAAQVLASEAAVATAKLQLDYCSIRAPIAGVAGEFGAHEGDLISATSSAALVVVNQISPTYVTFGVPQQYLADLVHYRAAGTVAVAATPPGSDTTPEKGELIFLDNAVDTSTGTIRLKATFPNTSRRLWPGQFVITRITLASPEAIVVSSSAIQNSQSGQHVFVVKQPGNIAELRAITVERRAGADTVISKGLAVGETVVVDGQLRVVNGRPVEIKPARGTAAPPAAPESTAAPAQPAAAPAAKP